MLLFKVLFIFTNLIVNLFNIVSTENAQFMSGFYTDGLDTVHDNVEIVYPEKVSKDGSFVSYYLPHFYNVESIESRPRREDGSSKDSLHFYVPIEGKKYQLELWPNLDFIGSSLVVERRDARDVENVNKAKITRVSQRQCHYNGRIVGKPSSKAALSTCYGLAGYIRVPAGDEYFIEPVKDSSPSNEKEHPHVIYKRSGKDKHSGSNCLTKGRAKDALDERLQWEAIFGDQVRKELSGTNINDLVKETPPKMDNGDRLKSERPLNGDIPTVEKSIIEGQNAKTYEQSKHMNGQQITKNDFLKTNQETPYSYNSLKKTGNPHNNENVRNAHLYEGGRLKQRPAKEQMNMGTINLPEVNLRSMKGSQSQVSDNNFYDHVNSKIGPYNEGNNGQRRFKRSLDSEIDYNTDIDGNDSRNNLNEPILDFSEETRNGKESSEEDISNERFRRDSDSKITFQKNNQLNSAQNKVNKVNPVNKDQFNSEKTNTAEQALVNKREDEEQVVQSKRLNPVKEPKHIDDGTNKHQHSHDIRVQNEIKDIQHNENKENNIKREIHLDTSEKSWQVANEDSSKINKKSDKVEYNNVYENDRMPEKKDINPSKTIHNTFDDEKAKQIKEEDKIQNSQTKQMMASVLQSVAKNGDNPKFKKEIKESEMNFGNINQQPFDLKPLSKQDDSKTYVKFDQICLSNDLEQDADSKKGDVSPKLVFVSKEGARDFKINGDQEPNQISLEETSDQNHVGDIVIRIKTPEGSISDVRYDGYDNRNTKNDLDQIKVNGAQNENSHIIQIDKSAVKTIASDKDKRGVTNKDKIPIRNTQNMIKPITSDKEKRGVTNNKETPVSPVSNTETLENNNKVENFNNKDQQTFNIVLEQDQAKPNVDYSSKHKTKRDDNTIHLIIESEPEINNDNSNANAQKPGLFCQGKNCLEIKPVILNDTVASVVQSNNNTNAESSKAKIMEKREVFPGECSGETTSELPPLVCSDIYSKMFSIELMVTVDYKVVKMHEDDDIENFILTIINMVATNFYDKSIGLNLSVVLVRLILLTTCIKELDSDRFNPEELLENFCTWQVLINPGKDDHPHHHDLAIFVTRMEKCEGQVMGVTYMTSVCRPDKACLVCVDEGLLLANTITHQIGHSLGAEHDDGSGSGCAGVLPDGTSHHMSPTITETSSAWSTCSRDAIIQFIRSQGSWCLNDSPIERSFNFPLMLPGQIYSAAQQCKLNFHMTALPCAVGSFCDKLYCQVTEKLCATKGDPPADGTFCASDMWCFHKQCVHIGRRPGAINGEWGPWTEWTLCTRSCGGGVSSSFRICNNPKPSNGGRYCVGVRIRHRMCATRSCSGLSESFRDLQCRKTEDRPFRGRLHNWSLYQSFFLNIECALVCQNKKGEVVMRSPIVADGTPCKAGTKNVCIQGTCRNVGCDWVIDSKAREDACGICHGNGTECKIIQGVFDEDTTQRGLVEFLRIPKNSGMVFVREAAPSNNVIVVSGSINRIYYLNGPLNEDSLPGDVAFGTTHGVYEMRSGMERIFIRGPTSEDLIFYTLFREPNKGIHYQYAVPETDPTYIPRYLWQYLDWDTCSDPCSGGSQRAHAKCVEDRGGVVDDQYCTETTRPMDVIRPCNDFPCQPKWWVSVWSDCICTGTTSVMFRSVLCMRATDESGTRAEIVRESECTAHKKPQTQKACNATDEDNECINKRSAEDGEFFGARNMRGISPNTAYVAYSPAEESGGMQDVDIRSDQVIGVKQEEVNSDKNDKKSVKTQNNKNLNLKSVVNKLKPKISERAPDFEGKRNFAAIKGKDTAIQKGTAKGIKESKPQVKSDETPIVANKGKQTAKLNSKGNAAIGGEQIGLRTPEKSKQVADSKPDSNVQVQEAKMDEKCETPSTPDGTCGTEATEQSECTTCKQTCAVLPHKRTTCCKTSPKPIVTHCPEVTTMRPVMVKLDELNHDFGLTVIPLEPKRKNLPQSDPEFTFLGNLGQFGVANQDNGTVIMGQEAIDFLDFARGNASEEPVILHDVHN